MRASREIRDLVRGFILDLADRVTPAVEVLSRSDNFILIGSDAEEYVEGGNRARALLAQQIEEIQVAEETTGRKPFDPTDVRVIAYETGDFGWAVCMFVSPSIEGVPVQWRNTFVLVREDRTWKIIHLHASNPVPNIESVGLEVTTDIEEVAELVEHERPALGSVTSPEGTVTIMFTDLEASTATNEAMGDDAFLPLLLKHNEIVRERTAEANGTVVKSQGDGFMLAFPSARRTVDCAIAIQKDVRALDDRIKVRMGVHTGEPIRHADDFYGRDVAYAARIGSAAMGSEILVSALVMSLVAPSGSVSFTGPRELELKGFDGPQQVYGVAWSTD